MKSNNKYMGIYSYQPEDKDVFWGRDVEKREVADTILNNFSTILSGSSGCGKTSLINAGVIPILDKCSYCAIRITPRRIWEKYCANGSEGRGDFAIYFWEEVDIEIEKRIKNDVDVCGRYYKSDSFSLWEKIFLCDFKKNRCKLYFLVIVDQFEEIFQLNLNIKEINRFFKIYEIMSNSYSPYYDYIQMINFNFETYSASKKLFPDRDIYEKFYSRLSTNNRFLISIRKDFLFELQSYSKYYPVLSQNVYYLENLDDDQAAIVIRSGCEEFQKLNTKEITGCIIEKYDFEDNDGEVDYRVDTLTLSMVMYEIWEKFERQEEGYDCVENITKDFKEKFDIILNDFYKDRINSMINGSDKGKKKKIECLENIFNNNSNLNRLQIVQDEIVQKFIMNDDGMEYNEEEIGRYVDEKFYGEKFNEEYVKRCCRFDTLKGKYYFDSKTVLGFLLSKIENNEDFYKYIDVVIKGESTMDTHFALLSLTELAYGVGRNSSYNEVNIRKEIIRILKKFSLIDSIRRCSNSIVKDVLEQHLNQIILEFQEKLLSDSGYRQSVYIDDICKLFDKYVYGDIESNKKRELLSELIKNDFLNMENGLLNVCVSQFSTDMDRICYLIENNYVHISHYCDMLDICGNNCCSFKEKDNGSFFLDGNGFLLSMIEIDKQVLVDILTPLLINKEFREDKNGLYFPAKNEINFKLLHLLFDEKNNNYLLPEGDKCFYYIDKYSFCNLIRCNDNIDDKFLMDLFNINQRTIYNLICNSEFKMTLLEEDEDVFRVKLNKCIYHINNEVGEKSDVRTEIADVIKNCKLFAVINKGNKENMLEFRHDRLCAMAKEYLEIHKIRQNNVRRYSADVYFSPQGRLKENNCFVECFMGPWYTYSTVMSSIYFMEGDKSSMIDFDTASITQLKKVNYKKASSAIVTVALHEKFRGKENEEYYYDLPTNFTHFRVKIEDNKIYNISFETREKNDTVVKKVVISTGYHKVRFYYDQYDRIVLKEFCVRKKEHKDFYKNDDANINLSSEDVRVVLPEVGYNAIYYKYKEVYYKCPSETYFLKIDLSKDLREMARKKELMAFYNELEEDSKLVKDLRTGESPTSNPKYIVRHIVDGNYGYKSRYDDYGRETSRRYFGGTIYKFDVIKLKYDKNDNVNSIAFYTKSSKKTTYKYPSQTDSCIHRIEFLPVDSSKGVCKKTIYYGKDGKLCFDKENNIYGKEYTYEGEQYITQNGKKHYILHKLTAKYIKDEYAQFDGNKQEGERVQEVIVRRDINESSVEIASFGDLEKTKKINGRKIFLYSNIFDYNTHIKCKKIEYHKIQFVYINGMVKTHIFTKDDEENYKYFIKRSGEVRERERLEYYSEKPRFIKICDDSIGVNDNISMMFVGGGEFKMGHDYDMVDYPYREAMPINNVRVDSFYIGQTTVTVGLWNSLMPDEKKCNGEKCYPAVKVKWDDVCEFIEKLNKIKSVKDEKLRFRLPTEAEWEYAARGGIYSQNYKYSGSNILENVAVTKTVGRRVSPEKKKDGTDVRLKNELGIYDMSGNVKEWCSDYFWLYPNTFGKTIDNPVGPSIGYARVVRGGGYQSHDYTCRVYNRDCSFPDYPKEDIGFRLVLEIDN